MGNGVKVLLVALLVVSVVVVAKFVQEDSESKDKQGDKKEALVQGAAKSSKTSVAPSRPTGAAKKGATTVRSAANKAAPGNSALERRRASENRQKPQSSSRLARNEGRLEEPSSAAQVAPSDRYSRPSAAGSKVVQPPTGSSTPAGSAGGGPKVAATSESQVSGQAAKSGKGNHVSLQGTPPAADLASGNGFNPKPPPTNAKTRRYSNPANSAAVGSFRASSTKLSDVQKKAEEKETKDTSRVATTFRAQHPFNKPVDPKVRRTTFAATASAAGTSPDGFPKEHTVRTGDSYWKLAELYYGPANVMHYKTIQRVNDGKKLLPGKKVTIPAPPKSPSGSGAVTNASTTSRSVSAQRSSRTPESIVRSKDGRYIIHTVQRGDTLMDLAKRYYDNPRAFYRIRDANDFLHYERLQAGQKIKVPVK